MPEIPKKKWYELGERREIFFPLTTAVVRDRLISTLAAGGLKGKSFWTGTVSFRGTLAGNFFDISIGVPAGKGTLDYQVYGELVSKSNGCLMQVVIRDSSPFYTALVVAAFSTFIFFTSKGFGIFGIFFFGGFACFALTIQHVLGVNAVTKAIRDSMEIQPI